MWSRVSVIQVNPALNQLSNLTFGRAMSTVVDTDRHKLDYMKNLAGNIDVDSKPADWDSAKPYSEIPGPKPIPILGNIWRYLPLVGNMYYMTQMQQQTYLNKTFGDIVKLSGLQIRKDLIILFNPDDIEKSYRNEGVWPQRESMDSFVHYKMDIRKDIFQGQGGVLTSQGENWYKTRSTINPVLMQPRSALMYVDSMNDVAQDFLVVIKKLMKSSPINEMPENFLFEIHKWALESISVVAFNKRLGLLDTEKVNPEANKFIQDVLNMFDALNDLDVKPSPWKYFKTPAYRKFIKTMDGITEFNMKNLTAEMQKIKTKTTDMAYNEMGVLEKLLQKDEKIALAMSFDMLIAGIDTTSRILSAALYFLATNPEAQNKLRTEVTKYLPNKDSPVTAEVLNRMSYLKAVVKETTRLAPIAIGNLRQNTKDLVLSGYQIPKGSDLIMAHMLLCRKDEHFKDPNSFIPDRFLREEGEYSCKNINRWVFQPFGFGPRSCIGKRLANLEIETLLSKLIRNYKLEWHHGEMKWIFTLLYGVGSPLKFKVTEVEK